MTAASQHVPRVMGITDFVALAVENVLGHLPLVVPSTVESLERQSYNIHRYMEDSKFCAHCVMFPYMHVK